MKKKSLTRIFQFALAVTSCFYIFRSEVEASYTGDSAKKIDTPTTLHNSATVKEEFLKKFTDKLDSKEIESIFSSDDLQTIKANIMAFADAQKKLVERTSSVKPTSKRKKKSFGQVNRTLLALATDLYNFAEMLDTSSQKQTKELTEKKSLHADYLDDGDDDYSTTLQNLGLEDEGAKKTSNPAEIRQLSVNENIFDTISNNVAAYKRLRKDSKYDDEITEIEEQIVQAKRSENEKDLSKQTKALELIFDSARRLSAVPVYMIKEITTDDYKDILSALIKKEIEEFSKLADGTMNYEFNKLISSLNVKIPFDQKIKIIINNAQQSVSSQSTEEQNVQLSNIRNAANLQNENLSISAKVTRVKNLIESYNRIANTPTTAFLPPDEVIINEMYVNLWNDHVLKLLEEIKPIITEEKERATKLCGKFNEEHETTSVNNSQAKEKLEEEYKKKLKDLESYNGSEKSKARKRKEYEIAHKKELSKLEEETDNKHINALSADSYIADLEELEEEIETTCKREANAESKDDAEKLMDSMANQLVKCLDKCEEIQTELDSKIKSDSAVADFKLPFTVDSIQDDVRIIKESLVSCKKTVVKKIEQIK